MINTTDLRAYVNRCITQGNPRHPIQVPAEQLLKLLDGDTPPVDTSKRDALLDELDQHLPAPGAISDDVEMPEEFSDDLRRCGEIVKALRQA